MIIEFIGSTGAGKTTLIKRVLSTGERAGANTVLGTDFVLRQSRLHGVKNPLARTILINLIAPFVALAAWHNNRAFYRFVAQSILELPGTVPWLERLVLAKNILKRVGVYEMIRRHGAEQQLYLVDEGTLHVAHSLFVQVAGEVDHQGLSTFASLVPLPHVAVYLQQEEAVLVARMLARGHQRVADRSVAAAAHFVHQAVTVFDELVQNPAIATKVVVVDGARQTVTPPNHGTDPLPARVAQLVQAGLCTSAAKVSI